MKTRFVESSRVKVRNRRDRRRVDATKWLYEHFAVEPEKAAKKTLKGIKRNKALVLIGKETYITYYLKRVFPGLHRRMASLASRFM
jgi:short-subunit dehydrogenase